MLKMRGIVMIIRLLALLMLADGSYTDLKRRTVRLSSVAAATAASLTTGFFLGGSDIRAIAAGALPGLVLLILSRLPGFSLGDGDAYVMMALGAMFGVFRSVFIIIAALLGSSISGILIITVGHGRKGDAMPFVPYIMFGYLMMLLMEKELLGT